MDEPTTGLDPRSRLSLWDIIREYVARGTTVFLTTQYLEEADQLAHTIVVIDQGQVIAQGTADELKKHVGNERLELTLAQGSDLQAAVAALKRYGNGSVTFDAGRRKIFLPLDDGAQRMSDVIRDLGAINVRLDDLSLRKPTLDDVFLALTGHGTGTKEENQ